MQFRTSDVLTAAQLNECKSQRDSVTLQRLINLPGTKNASTGGIEILMYGWREADSSCVTRYDWEVDQSLLMVEVGSIA